MEEEHDGIERNERERGVSRQSIRLKSQLGCFRTTKNMSFIGGLIVTVRSKRSTVTINGPSWTVFGNVASVRSRMEGQDLICR